MAVHAMAPPTTRWQDGRLVLEGGDPTFVCAREVLVDLVQRVNDLLDAADLRSAAPSESAVWEDVANLVQSATSIVTVNRATEQARRLAANPGCTSPGIGKDTVNLRLELSPEDSDRLLRWIGDRRGA